MKHLKCNQRNVSDWDTVRRHHKNLSMELSDQNEWETFKSEWSAGCCAKERSHDTMVVQGREVSSLGVVLLLEGENDIRLYLRLVMKARSTPKYRWEQRMLKCDILIISFIPTIQLFQQGIYENSTCNNLPSNPHPGFRWILNN